MNEWLMSEYIMNDYEQNIIKREKNNTLVMFWVLYLNSCERVVNNNSWITPY